MEKVAGLIGRGLVCRKIESKKLSEIQPPAYYERPGCDSMYHFYLKVNYDGWLSELFEAIAKNMENPTDKANVVLKTKQLMKEIIPTFENLFHNVGVFFFYRLPQP
jgi:hypothetical protein